MLTIWKYPVVVEDEQVLEMPSGARLLSIQPQDGGLQLWALVNNDAEQARRRIVCRGTGHNCDGVVGDFLGTVQAMGGGLVFHFFDGGEETP